MNALTSMIFTILLANVSSGMMDVVANDSCHYSNDGTCDEPVLEGGCAVGTDMNDCIGERYYPCQYINDGVCDEGPDHQYCLPGTDTNDCCENGMLKNWNETDINFGRDLSGAICEGFILDYRRMMATTPIQEEITPMTCSGVLECSNLLQEEKSNELKKETLEPIINELIKSNNINFKGVGQPLRIALTGSKVGPGIYDIIVSLGKEEIIKRLSNKIFA